MADKISVINRALSLLGERPINNPDAPETPSGKHVTDQFDQCRREVQRRHPWNFCEVWDELDKTTAPPFGFTDAYALPADFIRLLWVGEITETRVDYRLLYQPAQARRVIAIDNSGASKLKVAYAADVEVLSLWDPLALKVFALWLALDAAKAITGQAEHVKVLNELLSEELKDAVGVDGQEQAVLRHVDSDVQRARNSAVYSDYWATNERVKFY